MTKPQAAGAAQILMKARLASKLPTPDMCKALRVSCGVSAQEVAEAVGVTRQSVNRWERGERRPRGEALKAYAEVIHALQESQR